MEDGLSRRDFIRLGTVSSLSLLTGCGMILHPERRSLVAATWRFASGLTHPSFVRGRIANDFVRTDPDGDRSRGEMSASMPWVVSTASIALTLTTTALSELERSKTRLSEDVPIATPNR